jgi:Zn-dependent peptidase ImmA (M78 family)
LAHILFKTGGVDTRLDDYIDYLDDDSKLIEIYCNKFAGEFLVPKEDFENHIIDKDLDEKIFSDLATLYSVSREVILRKLLDMGKIERSYYLEKSREWIEQAKEAKKKKTNGKEGNYFNNIKAYLGKNYINLVFENLYQNKISRKSAADYLDIKVTHLPNLEAGYLKGTNV